MATRVNRAATAANKRGGKPGRRNHSLRMVKNNMPLNEEENQEVFNLNRHETVARTRNASTGIRTESNAAGVPEGAGYTLKRDFAEDRTGQTTHAFSIHCATLERRNELPIRFTREGENISPGISWTRVPPQTEELALLFEDDREENPDVYWLVYRIPPTVQSIPEGIEPGHVIQELLGTPLQGKNIEGVIGYSGPLPPLFEDWHHYRFRLFALDEPLRDLRPGMDKTEVFSRMKAHILEETEIKVRYRRIYITKR